jgi:hypothetical protein
LIDKLCQRFDGTLSVAFAKEIMFCISLLSLNSEKSISKFVSYFKGFKEFLYDAEFCSIVGEIVEKVRIFLHFILKILIVLDAKNFIFEA